MKRQIILNFLLLLINYNLNCQTWQNKWFSMEIPDNWRKPERDYSKYPPLKYKESDIMVYKDIRFTSKNPNGGVIVVETFLSSNGKNLNYINFIRKDSITLKEELTRINNLLCMKRSAILKVKDKDNILNYYCTIWYLQGKNRIYIITYGSYDNIDYQIYLPSVEKCILSFKEK